MAKITRFENMKVWQSARELTRRIYALLKAGALSKDLGLRDQMRRAAVSIGSNIVEGFERGGDREFIQFIAMAKGSCGELRSQLCTAFDVEHLTKDVFEEPRLVTEEISAMLSSLMRYLKSSELKGRKFVAG